MQLTRILMVLCVFGLLSGAKMVNESLIVLRAVELARPQDKAAATPVKGRGESLGEAFLATMLGLAGLKAPGVIDELAEAVKSQLRWGCGLTVASLLALCLVAMLHFHPRRQSALESARSRRRKRSS